MIKSSVGLKPGSQFIKIGNPLALKPGEKTALQNAVLEQNFALYEFSEPNHKLKTTKQAIKALGQQLGLNRLDAHLCADEDAITPLAVSNRKDREGYIPYTDKAIDWHTDGYYNPADKTIRALILHCAQTAAKGGANQVLDYELLHSWLSAENQKYVEVLMQPDVMTIPENKVDGKVIRPAISSPVFAYDSDNKLYMRYSARKRNIIWKRNPLVQEAVACISRLFKQHAASIPKVRLEPGQGMVCNNVLHTRTSFVNDAAHERIMLRARYYDKIQTC